MDDDVYGHVNDVHYYSYFDTAVNDWLVGKGLLSSASSPVVGLVVETGCTYFEIVAFPEPLEAGIAVDRLGTHRSATRVGIFKAAGALAAAQRHFLHVHVDRATQMPREIPDATRPSANACEPTMERHDEATRAAVTEWVSGDR